MKNEMEIIFDAVSDNESFARVAVAAFVSKCDISVGELADIKTAVSEAVTNSIIHGYENLYGYVSPDGRPEEEKRVNPGKVQVRCVLEEDMLHIRVTDQGKGMDNVEQAMEPLFTTRPELERSGMGFAFMEAFMDDLEVESTPGKGTVVTMRKKLGTDGWIDGEE